MYISLYPNNNMQNFTPKQVSKPCFMGVKQGADIFVSTAKTAGGQNFAKGFSISSPHLSTYTTSEIIDLSKPRRFEFINDEIKSQEVKLIVDFNPKETGQIYDRKTGEPIDVFIVKAHDTRSESIDSFHFFSKDLQKEYGYVDLDKDYSHHCYDMEKDYPELGIAGDRIIVDWLENSKESFVSGVGRLADKVAVKYCMDNDITPNIISMPGYESHIAHYKRGKRFIPPQQGEREYEFLMNTYGNPNPNEVLEKLIKDSEETGEKADISKWCEYMFTIYLPKNLVEKYKREIMSQG